MTTIRIGTSIGNYTAEFNKPYNEIDTYDVKEFLTHNGVNLNLVKLFGWSLAITS